MKYCTKCGKENDDSVNFCTACASPFAPADTQNRPAGNPQTPPPSYSQPAPQYPPYPQAQQPYGYPGQLYGDFTGKFKFIKVWSILLVIFMSLSLVVGFMAFGTIELLESGEALLEGLEIPLEEYLATYKTYLTFELIATSIALLASILCLVFNSSAKSNFAAPGVIKQKIGLKLIIATAAVLVTQIAFLIETFIYLGFVNSAGTTLGAMGTFQLIMKFVYITLTVFMVLHSIKYYRAAKQQTAAEPRQI